MTDPNASEQSIPNKGDNAGATARQPDHADGSPDAPLSEPQWQAIGQQDGPPTDQPYYQAPGPAYGQPYDQPHPRPSGQPNPQYGQPYAQPYAPAYGQPYATGPATNTLAIIALIAAFFFPPAGIVCGHIALGQIKTTGEAGRGLALAGVIIGYVWAALILLMFVLPLVMMGIFFPAFIGLGNM